jgi:acetyl esterase
MAEDNFPESASRAIAEPFTRALLDEMAAQASAPIDQVPLTESRKALRTLMLALDRPPVPGVIAETMDIPGPAGPVPVTVHRPENKSGPLPVAVYFHGGGWARGDREMYDLMCRYFAAKAQCLVVNVEYRLSPEHRFPAGLEDCHAVVRWLSSAGESIGGDPARIAVLGDSAGGNFAAAIAIMTRDEGITLCFQGLLYPGVDLRKTDTYGSRRKYNNLYYFLDVKRLHWYFDHYLNTPDEALDPRASPLLAPSHEGLPPAAIITASLDPLCDEGEAYARLLEAAHNSVEYRCFPGTVHGFASFSKAIPMGLEAQEWMAGQLARAFTGSQ